MDNKEFNLRKDWDSIETVASDIGRKNGLNSIH